MNYTSHIGQDRWVAEVFQNKKAGYFLDFGGFEGLMHSNTFYLEKFLQWDGILVEPNPKPFKSACRVRGCLVANYALWHTSRESVSFLDAHGLSSIEQFADCDDNAQLRKDISSRIHVDTINPNELLERFSAPEYIDFMSLDVEGAELQVLETLDLQKYKIALMSIEHNHDNPKKMAIRSLLGSFGYEFIEHRNDDFFFHLNHLEHLSLGRFEDPRHVQNRVINSYRMVEY